MRHGEASSRHSPAGERNGSIAPYTQVSRAFAPTSVPHRGEADDLISPCIFCDGQHSDVVTRSFTSLALRDAHPLSPGHTLVVPRRHVHSIFELDDDEYDDVWRLVRRVRVMLAAQHGPDGMTIGSNDGLAAGQTEEHPHVHVIPRFEGDVPDPRGGIAGSYRSAPATGWRPTGQPRTDARRPTGASAATA
jgi:diadenosine tetraphosphate (Ap4A) HIT family hydrolase